VFKSEPNTTYYVKDILESQYTIGTKKELGNKENEKNVDGEYLLPQNTWLPKEGDEVTYTVDKQKYFVKDIQINGPLFIYKIGPNKNNNDGVKEDLLLEVLEKIKVKAFNINDEVIHNGQKYSIFEVFENDEGNTYTIIKDKTQKLQGPHEKNVPQSELTKVERKVAAKKITWVPKIGDAVKLKDGDGQIYYIKEEEGKVFKTFKIGTEKNSNDGILEDPYAVNKLEQVISTQPLDQIVTPSAQPILPTPPSLHDFTIEQIEKFTSEKINGTSEADIKRNMETDRLEKIKINEFYTKLTDDVYYNLLLFGYSHEEVKEKMENDNVSQGDIDSLFPPPKIEAEETENLPKTLLSKLQNPITIDQFSNFYKTRKNNPRYETTLTNNVDQTIIDFLKGLDTTSTGKYEAMLMFGFDLKSIIDYMRNIDGEEEQKITAFETKHTTATAATTATPGNLPQTPLSKLQTPITIQEFIKLFKFKTGNSPLQFDRAIKTGVEQITIDYFNDGNLSNNKYEALLNFGFKLNDIVYMTDVGEDTVDIKKLKTFAATTANKNATTATATATAAATASTSTASVTIPQWEPNVGDTVLYTKELGEFEVLDIPGNTASHYIIQKKNDQNELRTGVSLNELDKPLTEPEKATYFSSKIRGAPVISILSKMAVNDKRSKTQIDNMAKLMDNNNNNPLLKYKAYTDAEQRKQDMAAAGYTQEQIDKFFPPP
jgi:hypothetical protein